MNQSQTHASTALLVLALVLSTSCQKETLVPTPPQAEAARETPRQTWMRHIPEGYPLILAMDPKVAEQGDTILPLLDPTGKMTLGAFFANILGMDPSAPLEDLEGLNRELPIFLALGGVSDPELMRSSSDGNFLDMDEARLTHGQMILPATDPNKLAASLKAWTPVLKLVIQQGPGYKDEIWSTDEGRELFAIKTLGDRVHIDIVQNARDPADARSWLIERTSQPPSETRRTATPALERFWSGTGPLAIYSDLGAWAPLYAQYGLIELASALSMAHLRGLDRRMGLSHLLVLEQLRSLRYHSASLDAVVEVEVAPHLSMTVSRTLRQSTAEARTKARAKTWPVYRARAESPLTVAHCRGDLRTMLPGPRATEHLRVDQGGSIYSLYTTLDDLTPWLLSTARVHKWSPRAIPSSLTWLVESDEPGAPVGGIAAVYPEAPEEIEIDTKGLKTMWKAWSTKVEVTRKPLPEGTLVLVSVGKPPEALFDLDNPLEGGPDIHIEGAIPSKGAPAFFKGDALYSKLVDHSAGNLSVTRMIAAPRHIPLPHEVEPVTFTTPSATPPGEKCLVEAVDLLNKRLKPWADNKIAEPPSWPESLLPEMKTALACALDDPKTQQRANDVLAGLHLFDARRLEWGDKAHKALTQAQKACALGRKTACRLQTRLTPPKLTTPLKLAQTTFLNQSSKPYPVATLTITKEGVFIEAEPALALDNTKGILDALEDREPMTTTPRPDDEHGPVHLSIDATLSMAHVEPILRALNGANWPIYAQIKDDRATLQTIFIDPVPPGPAPEWMTEYPCVTANLGTEHASWDGALGKGKLNKTTPDKARMALWRAYTSQQELPGLEIHLHFDPKATWQRAAEWFALMTGFDAEVGEDLDAWRVAVAKMDHPTQLRFRFDTSCPAR